MVSQAVRAKTSFALCFACKIISVERSAWELLCNIKREVWIKKSISVCRPCATICLRCNLITATCARTNRGATGKCPRGLQLVESLASTWCRRRPAPLWLIKPNTAHQPFMVAHQGLNKHRCCLLCRNRNSFKHLAGPGALLWAAFSLERLCRFAFNVWFHYSVACMWADTFTRVRRETWHESLLFYRSLQQKQSNCNYLSADASSDALHNLMTHLVFFSPSCLVCEWLLNIWKDTVLFFPLLPSYKCQPVMRLQASH